MGYVALRAKRFCFIFLISDNDELSLGGTGSIGDLEWHNVLGDNPLFWLESGKRRSWFIGGFTDIAVGHLASGKSAVTRWIASMRGSDIFAYGMPDRAVRVI
jgi:hypothetical protein